MIIEIENKKYEDYTHKIADNSVDFVCIDPPYTDGDKDVLGGHKIQTKIDIDHVISEAYRILKPNGFLAFFGQMPSLMAWNISASKKFNFKQEIIWNKRNSSLGGNLQIRRLHENIEIFVKGSSHFYITEGVWEDLTRPMVETGNASIETVFRELSYWKSKAKGRKVKNHSKVSTNNYDFFLKKGLGTKKIAKTLGKTKSLFSSIWVFHPHNKKYRNPTKGQVKHPTVKSIDLLERLIELCTPEPTAKYTPVVVDFFLGSGTTSIACVNTNRSFKGCEMDKTYFETEIIPRTNQAIKERNKNMFVVSQYGYMDLIGCDLAYS